MIQKRSIKSLNIFPILENVFTFYNSFTFEAQVDLIEIKVFQLLYDSWTD